MLSAHLRLSVAAGRRFVDALTLFGIGYSWGGFESLVQFLEPKALAGHSYWRETGIEDGIVVRLHIGLESPEDVIADLGRALALAQN